MSCWALAVAIVFSGEGFDEKEDRMRLKKDMWGVRGRVDVCGKEEDDVDGEWEVEIYVRESLTQWGRKEGLLCLGAQVVVYGFSAGRRSNEQALRAALV